jgi:2-polyprenyl-6-methoxyphenol hydroxylase-like FAD-dependent oxidoreductase
MARDYTPPDPDRASGPPLCDASAPEATMASLDVLVVGAGPTGLMAACALRRHGLSVRIVDSSATPTTLSKAIALHARTLEILEDFDLAESIVAAGLQVKGVTVVAAGETLVSADLGELPTRYPYVLCIPQADTEAILAKHLGRLEVSVERESKLVSFTQDGTGVTAQLTTPKGKEQVRAAWLIGADGAHSTVRKQLEISFEGSTYEERFVLADVKIVGHLRNDRITSFFAEDGVLACFPMKDDRFRLIGLSSEDQGADEEPTLEKMSALFAKRSGLDAVVSDARWLAQFRVHCRQVAKYRDDRVFLAGDAAHIHSPVGGQGMNTGLQDAHNLAWKLALVHRGTARGLLLDSYQAERHAVGSAILRGTDAATRAITLKNSVARTVRNEVARFMSSFELVQRRVAEQAAELSVSYQASPIVAQDTTSLLQGRIGTAAGGDAPTIGSIREFDAAPKPGSRAPDGVVAVAGQPGSKRLLALVDSRKHTLLLFDGRSESAEGYARFAAIAAAIQARFGSTIETMVVTPRRTRPEALAEDTTVLLDADAELERAYAASTECLYLLRPDLYIAYRSQPADEGKLVTYLKSIFR